MKNLQLQSEILEDFADTNNYNDTKLKMFLFSRILLHEMSL